MVEVTLKDGTVAFGPPLKVFSHRSKIKIPRFRQAHWNDFITHPSGTKETFKAAT